MKCRIRGLALCGVALALVWHAPQAGATGTQEAGKKGPVTLTFYNTEAGDPTMEAYYDQVNKEFEAKFPSIKVEHIANMHNIQENEAKLNALMISSQYPDLLLVPLIMLGSHGFKNELAELSSYMDGWADRKDFYQSSIDIGRAKGKLLGMGVYPVPELFVYRKDFFKDAGLDPSKPPQDWKSLLAAAQKAVVRDANGVVTRSGFDMPLVDKNMTVIEAFLRMNGNSAVDEMAEKPVIDQPSAVEAFDYMASYAKQKLILPYDTQKGGEMPFRNSRGAMGMVATPNVRATFKATPDLKTKVGFGSVLKNTQQASFCGYRLFLIGQSSQKKNEAFEYLKFYLSAEKMWERFEKFSHQPIRASLEPRFTAADPEFNASAIEHVKFGKGRPVVSWVNIFSKHTYNAYEEVMSLTKPAAQALKEASAKITEELANLPK
jgi:ABC-type glycerol-3-phosphate transport system substrate-binding protein